MTIPETVRFLVWNIERGQHTKDALRWISRLPVPPAAVLWQELQPGDVETAEATLGMRAFLAEARPNSTHHNAILLDESGPLALEEEFVHPAVLGHAPANIAVRLRGPDGTLSDRALTLLSVHASSISPTYRLMEAEFLARFADPKWLTLAAGDFNSYPSRSPGEGPHAIDWTEVPDRVYYMQRTHQTAAGRDTDDRPDATLLAAGYLDAARWAAEHLHQQHDALAPTAGYGKPRQCGLRRIDRAYLSGPLAPTLMRFEVCDSDELRSVSDHLPLIIDLDAEKLRQVMKHSTVPVGL